MTQARVRAIPATTEGYALVGDAHAQLLAGPVPGDGAETLACHHERLGALPRPPTEALLTEIATCGLVGRGGGGFPLARKVEAVAAAVSRGGAAPVVVVNASESEPASRKDETLLALRPHLVLDGAAVAAQAVGATDVIVHVHRGSGALAALQGALAERHSAGLADPTWRVTHGPRRYVSGESSAVVSFVEGGLAKPRFATTPLAVAGLSGRPTLLNNAETIAHLALIARHGADRWRSSGASRWSGPTLVTLHGAVAEPGLVVEVTGELTIGALLASAGGWTSPPAAVLIGGYAGTWLAGDRAWRLRLERAAMCAAGASPGCGLIAVLPPGACGVRETARIVSWLAGEGAGQCGPCMFGLPAIAELFADLAAGHRSRRTRTRFARLADRVEGRGACRHPDGLVQVARSALDVFAADVQRHVKGRRCGGESNAGVLPMPVMEAYWR